MLETQSAKIVLEALRARRTSSCKPIVALNLVDNPNLDDESAKDFAKLTEVKTFFRHRAGSTEFEKFGEVHPVLLERELLLNPGLTSLTVCKSGKAPGAARKGFEFDGNLPLGKVVGEALSRSSCLTSIDLRLCSLGSSGLNALIKAADRSSLYRVEHLNLGYNNIGLDGAKALADVLCHNDAERSVLKKLSVAGNSILDGGADHLLKFLRNASLCPHFKELDLRLNGLSKKKREELQTIASPHPDKKDLRSNDSGSDTCLRPHSIASPARANIHVILLNNIDASLALDNRKAKDAEGNKPPADGAAISDSADAASLPPLIVCGALNMDLLTRSKHHLIKSDEDKNSGSNSSLRETVSGSNFYTSAGGKGLNQSMAASRLLQKIAEMCPRSTVRLPEIHLIGAVGNDSNGTALKDELTTAGVDTDVLYETSEATTGVANSAHACIRARPYSTFSSPSLRLLTLSG